MWIIRICPSKCFPPEIRSNAASFRTDNLSANIAFAPNGLIQRRSSIQQMGETVCSLVRYRRTARSRNSVNYISQFMGGWT
jgi:hypothetical protein